MGDRRQKTEEALALCAQHGLSSERERPIAHYFYCPDESMARDLELRLAREGFDVEVRLGADGRNWLALAKHSATLATIEQSSERLEALADAVGAEYDGWEADTRPERPTA